MAEENQDEKKPSRLMPILKWIGIGGGLLTVGVVAGYFVFSPAGDVIEKEELEQMIERSIVEREEAKAAEETAAAGPEKVSKDAPEEKKFETIYYEFAGTFTTNLQGSRKMLQVGIAVSTQYDNSVMESIEAHEIGLRSLVIEHIGNYSEEDVKGEAGKRKLAESLKTALNQELEALKEFGGIEKVHFTSFVLQ